MENLLKQWFIGENRIRKKCKMNEYERIQKLNIQIPINAQIILEKLNEAGFEAFIVGGCVRDSILGKTPDDWDITTSAKPKDVKTLFRRTIDTGIQHGTVTVMMDKEGYEITTYRIDGEYLDGRHPESVEFTSNLIEDLKRRDFTINAMAYNPICGVVDEFGGIYDLEHRIVRCVGEAEERFTEDALRILRAVRFSAQLGFVIEVATKDAILRLASNLQKISKERIRVELDKLLISKEPQRIGECCELGISKYIMPWLDTLFETTQKTPYHMYNVGEHTMVALQHIEADSVLRWTMLLHDVAKPETKTVDQNGIEHFYGHAELGEQKAKSILKDLRFDNKTISVVTKLIKYHDYHRETYKKVSVRKSISLIGKELYPLFLKVKEADDKAKSLKSVEKGIEEIRLITKFYDEILAEENCVSLKELAISGDDLIDLGVPKGREIGDMLNVLLNIVIEDPTLNTKESLSNLVKSEKIQ